MSTAATHGYLQRLTASLAAGAWKTSRHQALASMLKQLLPTAISCSCGLPASQRSRAAPPSGMLSLDWKPDVARPFASEAFCLNCKARVGRGTVDPASVAGAHRRRCCHRQPAQLALAPALNGSICQLQSMALILDHANRSSAHGFLAGEVVIEEKRKGARGLGKLAPVCTWSSSCALAASTWGPRFLPAGLCGCVSSRVTAASKGLSLSLALGRVSLYTATAQP